MDHRRLAVAVTLLSLVIAVGLARANDDARLFLGIDLGTARPVNDNYRAHVVPGGTGNPYVGYMFNDNLGLEAQIHVTVHPADDNDRGFKDEEDPTTLLGYTAGPRVDFPLNDTIRLYTTAQGGGFTGLSGRLTQTSPGFSLGGGVDIYLTRNVAFSLFGRYNRAYQAPRPTFLGPPVTGPPAQKADQQGPEDIRWATAGIGLKYDFRSPPPPPPAPPVAQAPPPPPPPPPPPVKRKIVLRSVHFDFDKASIRADALPVLDEAVATLKEEGEIQVIVEGHTDSLGSEAYNEGLSRRRAQAVRQYLVDHDISADRIRTEAYGESRPVASNDTEDGRAQNRRVELRVE